MIVPNHKSFWGGFFIAACLTPHPFHGQGGAVRAPHGTSAAGSRGIPCQARRVRRRCAGHHAGLARGDILALFPDGTRFHDPDALGTPKRGAARLAIEAAAPLIPTAITGTEKRKWPPPRRVQVAFGRPVPVGQLRATPADAGKVLTEDVWPTIDEECARPQARPGLIVAGLTATGVVYAVRRARKN